jgi:hypothetical protein
MEPTGHSGSTAMTRRKTSQFKASAALVALVALPAALAAPARRMLQSDAANHWNDKLSDAEKCIG